MPDTTATPTRHRILECAETLFGQRGYDAVAVADIARACEVSTALIYYHFADKESLLQALVDRASEVFDGPVNTALRAPGTPRQRIERFISAWIVAVHDHASLVRILVRPLADPAGPLSAELLTRISATVGELAETIAEGIEAGEFSPEVDPWLAAECLYGLVNTRVAAGVLEVPYEERARSDTDSVTAFVTRVFFEGIAR
ncbi:MAG TPA: TetR/AcrR family transcriptional regulator [Coriobacteriia bacterium]|nr:TetR/AcrR family transcriptional regulator [Coriobacteriia bacterium]